MALGVGFAGGRATLGASGAVPAADAAAQATPITLPQTSVASYSAVVDRVAPAVVTVRVQKKADAQQLAIPDQLRDFFGPGFQVPRQQRPRRESGLGSGVIVSSDGHILTNNHVVENATKISVELADGRTLSAKLVGTDAASDLAVLDVEATSLPTVRYGDSESLKVGDVVLAFGNPLGVGQTVTMGIVSAKGRATGLGDGSYEDFLQTDAPINQGNSGGALVNLQGELVGINAQILSPTGGNIGLGFAIPSSMVQAVAGQLTTDGTVRRSKIGVTIQGVTPELAESLDLTDTHGALVGSVERGSPAEQAGIRQGDVIVKLNNRSVDPNSLRNQVANMKPGTSVSIELLRGGRTQTVNVKLAERERESARANTPANGEEDSPTPSKFGMTVQPLTPQLAQSMDLPRNESGLVVTSVDPGGTAAEAGLRAGDVIKRVNDREVGSVSALQSAVAARTNKPALVLVSRDGTTVFVALPQTNG
jgi:serine protease Do